MPVLHVFVLDAHLQQRFVTSGDGIDRLRSAILIILEQSLLKGILNELVPIDLIEVNRSRHEFGVVRLHLVDEMQECVHAHVGHRETEVNPRYIKNRVSFLFVLGPTQFDFLLLRQQDVRRELLQTVLIELVLEGPVVAKRVRHRADFELDPTVIDQRLFYLTFLQLVAERHPVLLRLHRSHNIFKQILLEPLAFGIQVDARRQNGEDGRHELSTEGPTCHFLFYDGNVNELAPDRDVQAQHEEIFEE